MRSAPRTSSGVNVSSKGHDMSIESMVGLTVSVLLLAYLVYALLYPEKF